MIIAIAVSKWYFTKDKSKLGFSPVLRSIGTTLFYHLGTCAYGSLILATIQLIRAMIARAQKAAKKANSKIAGCVLCCCQCCFCVLECCMKFLSKNGELLKVVLHTVCLTARYYWILLATNIMFSPLQHTSRRLFSDTPFAGLVEARFS
jgi:hypothetical protein